MNAYWQNLKASAIRDAVLLNFNWMCWASKERPPSKRKVEGSAWETGRLPHVHRSAWFSTLDVILQERKPKKKHSITKHQYLKMWEGSCGPRVWQALVIVNVSNVYVPAIAKCFQENLSRSDLLPLSTKQMPFKPMHMEASVFAKKTPKLSDNYFCTGKTE